MRRSVLAISLMGALLISMRPMQSAAAEGPVPVVDQSFTSPTNAGATFAAVPFSYVAQTFTVGVTGVLTGINVDISSAPILGGLMSISIMAVTDGVPNGNVLGQYILSDDDMQQMYADPLAFNAPMPQIYMAAGTQYAIVAYFTQYSNVGIPQASWSGATGNLYAGGSVFSGSDDAFSQWTPAADPGLDLHFRTLVITGMPVSDLAIARVSGAKHARDCQVFSEIYSVTNLGPDAATNVFVTAGMSDQFNALSVNGLAGGSSDALTLDPGQTMLIKIYYQVVAYGPDETPNGWVSASIFSEIYPNIAIDPDQNNNYAGKDVRLLGQGKKSCYP